MYHSDCYNFEWFVAWLKRSLTKNLVPQNLMSAKNISDKFSRLYFEVSIEDVINAMKIIEIPCVKKPDGKYYSVSFTEEVNKKLWKTWE